MSKETALCFFMRDEKEKWGNKIYVERQEGKISMRKKALFPTALVIGLLSSVTVYGKTVDMNLFYNGKNHDYHAKEVNITIDGKQLVPTDMPAVIVEERTYLPMRLIAEELGCEVTWNEETQQIFLVNDNDALVFTVGEKMVYRNGQEMTIDAPPMIINDRTMMPVRGLADALQCSTTWDDPTRTVNIVQGVQAEEQKKTESEDSDKESEEPALQKVKAIDQEKGSQVYMMQFTKPVDKITEVLSGSEKVVLEFADTVCLDTAKQPVADGRYVSQITVENVGEQGTRITFAFTENQSYELSQSIDGTQVFLSIDKARVEDISGEYDEKENEDIIRIWGKGLQDAKVTLTDEPKNVIVEIPNGVSAWEKPIKTEKMKFVQHASASMREGTTLYLAFSVAETASLEQKISDKEILLRITGSLEDTQNGQIPEGIFYDSRKNVLYLEKEKEFDVRDVVQKDRYLEGYFELILPGDYSHVYRNGTYAVGNDVLKDIQVSTVGGKTVLHFNQNRISAYEIEDEKDRYAVYVKNPKEVYDKVLILDAGHGGKDPGTIGNGLNEKDMALDVVKKTAEALKGSGVQVYLTRDSDIYPENTTRIGIANQIADALVTVHMNSGPIAAHGTEMLYKDYPTDDASKLTSKKLATIMQKNVVAATGNADRGLKLRTDLLILNQAKVPAIFAEIVFLTNPNDALKIASEAYQEQVALGLARGIQEAMSLPLR